MSNQVKKLQYFAVTQCLNQLGYGELNNIKNTIDDLKTTLRRRAEEKVKEMVREYIPERDREVEWVDGLDYLIIKWNNQTVKMIIKEKEMQINFLTFGGWNRVSTIQLIPDDKVFWRSEINWCGNDQYIVMDSGSFFKDWVFQTIKIYGTLAFNYDKIKKAYYDELNQL